MSRSHDAEPMMVTPLESFPPRDQWDDWKEYDGKAWPKKVEKRYTPDWSDKVYTVRSKLLRNSTTLDRLASLPVTERQTMYVLDGPLDTLSATKKGMYARNELLLVQKAH